MGGIQAQPPHKTPRTAFIVSRRSVCGSPLFRRVVVLVACRLYKQTIGRIKRKGWMESWVEEELCQGLREEGVPTLAVVTHWKLLLLHDMECWSLSNELSSCVAPESVSSGIYLCPRSPLHTREVLITGKHLHSYSRRYVSLEYVEWIPIQFNTGW